MHVIDILNKSNLSYLYAFYDFLEKAPINYSSDKMIKNYELNQFDPSRFDAFHIIWDGTKILGFAGMQSYPYPDDHSRVLTRLFYGKELRNKDLRGHKLPSFSTNLILPKQIQLANSKNKNIIFLSFEGLNRRRFCIKLADALKKSGFGTWKLSNKMHNTARKIPSTNKLNMSQDVWQTVLFCPLKPGAELNLPAIDITEWKGLSP